MVQKYGGTSVATPDRIRSVALRIAQEYRRGTRLVIVVSAMGHTTDELIELAERVSPTPADREMDMLLTAGERISMSLLSMALADLGIRALSFTGSQAGILTSRSHRRARIHSIKGDRIREALSQNAVAIVAGFQGVSDQKEITTLGRGGSDTTAVALAAVLGADECQIYTDVDGVYSADPRLVPSARFWKRIPHECMVELATRGAGVLHPRSVELAKQFGVKLVVKNSLRPLPVTGEEQESSGGTEIVSLMKDQSRGMEEFRVVGVTADMGKARVWLKGDWSRFSQELIATSKSRHLAMVSAVFGADGIEFFSERDALSEWQQLLQTLLSAGKVLEAGVDPEVVPLSVVGERFTQDASALAEVLDVLSRSGVTPYSGAVSSLALTVGVSKNSVQAAVGALHTHFFGQ